MTGTVSRPRPRRRALDIVGQPTSNARARRLPIFARWEALMFRNRSIRAAAVLFVLAVVLGLALASGAPAQGKKLKIGVVYDYTGPLAGGGSELHALGAKIMIDYFIKKGGVEGYQIEAVYADAQSKADDALHEGGRLSEQAQ